VLLAAVTAVTLGGCDDPHSAEVCGERPGGDAKEVTLRVEPSAAVADPSAEDVERTVEVLCERLEALDADDALAEADGAESIEVVIPEDEDAERVLNVLTEPAQLHFYDWEPNVVTNTGVPRETADAPFPRQYYAAVFASAQKGSCEADECTTAGPSYYLFEPRSKKALAGPAISEEALYQELLKREPEDGGEVVTVPRGLVLVREQAPLDDPATKPDELAESGDLGYFVLRDRPALSGEDIRNPEVGADPMTNQPVVTFEFTDEGRVAFQDLTAAVAERGMRIPVPAVSCGEGPACATQFGQHFAIVLGDEIVSRPTVNFIENPHGLDGRNGAQIEGAGSVQEAEDLAEFLEIGALPVNLVEAPES
jgi:SecD/SecF fusion protein